MTSLTTAPIADVLERLFADAARTQAAFADRARRHPREAGKMDIGVSTICLAAAVQDNNGDIVIGTEYEPGKVAAARQAIKTAGLDGLVEIRQATPCRRSALTSPARSTWCSSTVRRTCTWTSCGSFNPN